MLKALNLLTLFYTMTWPFACLFWGWSLPDRSKSVWAAFQKFVFVVIAAAAINAVLYICVVVANNPDKYFN